MEELASHGYAVFSVAHTYEALVATFPGGRTIPRDDARIQAFYKESEIVKHSLDTWTRDTAFMVDGLEKLDRGDGPFAGTLDTSRLGVFGHSFGGATAGQFCLADERCKAGLSLDGAQYGNARDWAGMDRPFMMATSGENTGMNGSLIRRSNAPTYRLSVAGSTHLDFTDLTLVSPLFRWAGYLGPTSGEHMSNITNAYTLAFFDRHLLGANSPLLEGASPEYPEAKLWVRNP